MLFVTHKFVTVLLLFVSGAYSLDNGLARTPPMGWMDWLKYECNLDCVNFPNHCINEQLYKDMIDRIAEDGWLQLGYNTVNIDDCWMERNRDATTFQLVADRKRFPNGIKSLVDYARSKGINVGIYEDIGRKTCAGFPGTFNDNGTVNYSDIDTKMFSDWGVGSLKLDGCYMPNETLYNETYIQYGKQLAKQQHKIVYACSWPAYMIGNLTEKDYQSIQDHCNYWRNWDDIMDSFKSVQSIIETYRLNVSIYSKYHGPGGWFDPDMLIIGNDGLTYEQSKTQMAFWCLWSAPLLMSNDLRTIKPEFKQILQNKHLIAVDQDPLGIMGHVVKSTNYNKYDDAKYGQYRYQVWVKKLSPVSNGLNPYVVLYYNQKEIGVPAIFSYKLSDLIPELNQTVTYDVHDLFADYAKIDSLKSNQKLKLQVKTSGSVRMVKLVPVV